MPDKDPIIFEEPDFDVSIKNYADAMATEAHKNNTRVVGSFDGEELICDANTTPEEIVAYFNDRLTKPKKNLSPKEQEALDQHQLKVTNLNDEFNRSILKLETLDYNNSEAILDWLYDFVDLTDNSNVKKTRSAIDKIINTFEQHGYEVVNTDADKSKLEDKEYMAHWIVGLSLRDLKEYKFIHSACLDQIDKWRKIPSN